MCLLQWMVSLKAERNLSIYAAHFEHGLRGAESLRDAAFVKKYCDSIGVFCAVGNGDVQRYAMENGIGLEEAARILRYRFLEETANCLGCTRIATAHNADDNAETILMNLCRGAGLRGLTGIPPVRDNLIRPLLRTERREISAFLSDNAIPYIEDSSNSGDDYTRNRIRHHVIPALKDNYPALLAALGRTSELLREDENCLCAMAEEFIEKNYNGESVPSAGLAGLDTAVGARVVRLLCGTDVSMERTKALLRFASGTEPGVLELPGRKIIRKHGRLYFPDKRN